LHKNTSYYVKIVKIGPPAFLHSSPFTKSPKSYALQYFSIGKVTSSSAITEGPRDILS